MQLTVEITKPEIKVKEDGCGLELNFHQDNYSPVVLKIGDVSVAFSPERSRNDEDARGMKMLFGPYTDNPVEYREDRVDEGDNPGEKLLIALAKQYGYTLTKAA